MTNDDVLMKLADVEHRATSNTRRIDKLEQQTDILNSLASSVEVMANEQKHQTSAILDIKTNVTALSGKVETLERKPGKRWEAVVTAGISALVGALIGFIIS